MGTSNGANTRNPLRHTHVSAAPRPRSPASRYSDGLLVRSRGVGPPARQDPACGSDGHRTLGPLEANTGTGLLSAPRNLRRRRAPNTCQKPGIAVRLSRRGWIESPPGISYWSANPRSPCAAGATSTAVDGTGQASAPPDSRLRRTPPSPRDTSQSTRLALATLLTALGGIRHRASSGSCRHQNIRAGRCHRPFRFCLQRRSRRPPGPRDREHGLHRRLLARD